MIGSPRMDGPPRSFGFLVNPTAGGGAAMTAFLPLTTRLRRAGCDVAVRYTSSPDEVPAVVTEFVGAGRIVVSVGGDGMVSSIAGSVSDIDGELAIVPAGRGNDFARMLQIPHEVDEQARLLLTGEPREVDLLDAWLPGALPRLVAGSVYAGVDARAAAYVGRSQLLPGAVQYPVAAVRALATYRPVVATLDVDGETSEHEAATIVIANSAYYGKGMQIAPEADVSDGLLDVVVVEATSRTDLIRSLPKLYDGSHTELDEVIVRRGRSVRLSGVFGDGRRRRSTHAGPVPVGADGEPLGDLPSSASDRSASGPQIASDVLEVSVRPQAIRVLC